MLVFASDKIKLNVIFQNRQSARSCVNRKGVFMKILLLFQVSSLVSIACLVEQRMMVSLIHKNQLKYFSRINSWLENPFENGKLNDKDDVNASFNGLLTCGDFTWLSKMLISWFSLWWLRFKCFTLCHLCYPPYCNGLCLLGTVIECFPEFLI